VKRKQDRKQNRKQEQQDQMRQTRQKRGDGEAGLERSYVSRLDLIRSGGSSSSSLSSSERDRFFPRPRHVISGYSHFLQRFAHCWQELLSWSPGKGRHCIFRRRQNRQASLARNTGRLRPKRGRLKADSRALLLSREDDNVGAPIEDDGRDDSGESGLDAVECSSFTSLADPGAGCS